jgi:uncharacterized protein YndB with AHSA1/START domain
MPRREGAVTVRIQSRVVIAAPPERVFAAAVDWDLHGKWVLFTRVTAEPGGHRVGERLVAVTKLAGIGFSDPMEVTRWEPEPPRSIEVRHLGRVVNGTGRFVVDPAPGGSWLTWTEELELPLGLLGRIGFVLVGPLAQLMLRISLTRLARLVEQGRDRPARPSDDPMGG